MRLVGRLYEWHHPRLVAGRRQAPSAVTDEQRRRLRSREATSVWSINFVPDEDAQVEGEVIHQDPDTKLIAEMEENGADSGLEEGFAENDPAAVAMAAFYVDGRPFRLSVDGAGSDPHRKQTDPLGSILFRLT
ncbi:hypothetical protein ACQJBY_055139 [Aegilops geniculata]